MTKGKNTKCYCTQCGKDQPLSIRKHRKPVAYHGKKFSASLSTAVCQVCGCILGCSALDEINRREIDDGYRLSEGLITSGQIRDILNELQIDSKSFSVILGLPETAIEEYMDKVVPSKKVSDNIWEQYSNLKHHI